MDASKFASFGQGKFDKDSVLSLQGFNVATIQKRIFLEKKFGIEFSDHQLHHAVAFLEEHISQHFKTSLHQSPQLYDVFLESPFKGWKWYAGSNSTPTLATRYKVWRGHASIPADFDPYVHPTVRRKNYLGTLKSITRLMLRVSDIFITSNGLIGSISKHCQANVGDKICIFFGGNAPFILKKYKLSDDSIVYKLRCTCF